MKKQKMNVLFKIAFILLIICVLLILASIIIAYAFDIEDDYPRLQMLLTVKNGRQLLPQAEFCLQP